MFRIAAVLLCEREPWLRTVTQMSRLVDHSTWKTPIFFSLNTTHLLSHPNLSATHKNAQLLPWTS
jgi:hypothetical protein